MSGYWWQCENEPTHRGEGFISVCHFPLVQFLYHLANHDWDQSLLTPPCLICKTGLMRITYEFPREIDPEVVSVHHIVGFHFDEPGHYLPMLWESLPFGAKETWFDFKYVNRDQKTGAYQSYGLARPAVFSKSELANLFKTYHRIVGHPVFSQD